MTIQTNEFLVHGRKCPVTAHVSQVWVTCSMPVRRPQEMHDLRGLDIEWMAVLNGRAADVTVAAVYVDLRCRWQGPGLGLMLEGY